MCLLVLRCGVRQQWCARCASCSMYARYAIPLELATHPHSTTSATTHHPATTTFYTRAAPRIRPRAVFFNITGHPQNAHHIPPPAIYPHFANGDFGHPPPRISDLLATHALTNLGRNCEIPYSLFYSVDFPLQGHM